MKAQLKLAALALLLSTLNAELSTARAQGSLTPPGAPAPTMKSLAQVEPRTPISSVPVVITQPGSYYLTTNLTTSSGDAIEITASGVTLDLKGFSISSTLNPAAGYGIVLVGSVSDVTILNGHINGGVTNNGSGVYSGSGFGYGISASNGAPSRIRISGVSVVGCLYQGINLFSADTVIIESCAVRTTGGLGVAGTSVRDSEALDCGGHAIAGINVINCRGTSTGNGSCGIYAQTALNCYGSSPYTGVQADAVQNCLGENPSNGAGINGTSIQNSVGESFSGSGIGILGVIAQHCYGLTFGSGTGVDTSVLAESCCGISNGSGNGVDTTVAHNCWGRSSSGIGVRCLGGNSGTGIATAYYGESTSYIGLNAYIANGCVGVSPTPISVSFKYNMP